MGLFGAAASYAAFSIVHFFQFVLAVAVCGLYGVELHRTSKGGTTYDGKLIYAEVVGGLSAMTAILYFIPCVLRFAVVWIWNAVIFALWVVLLGLFGGIYIKKDADGDSHVQRMKASVWVVLASALLWFITGLASFGYWWHHRERHTRFTGRGKI